MGERCFDWEMLIGVLGVFYLSILNVLGVMDRLWVGVECLGVVKRILILVLVGF